METLKGETMNTLPKLRPGLIINCSTKSTFGWLIRWVLSRNDPDCPNHDAIVVKRDGQLWIGESLSPVAKLTSIDTYNTYLQTGHVFNLKVLKVVGATAKQERDASHYFEENIVNSVYDYMAFPRLVFKALFGDWIQSVAGWEWAFFCTEGVRQSYLNGAKLDPWRNLNPTPLTTRHRFHEGVLKEVL